MTARRSVRLAAAVALIVALAAAAFAYAASMGVSSNKLTAFVTSTSLSTTSTTTATTVPTSATCTLSADADTYIASTSATSTFGTAPIVRVDRRDSPSQQIRTVQGLVKFTLAGGTCAEGGTLPSGKTLTAATLSLMPSLVETAADPVSVCPAAATWSEATSWSGTSPADANLQSRTACASSTSNVTSTTHTVGTRETWSVLTHAQAIYSGTITNNGWIVRNTQSTSIGNDGHAFEYASRDNATAANRPQLIITYTP